MKLIRVFLFAISMALTLVAQGGPVPWKENSYTYYAQNTTLGKALNDFGKTFGIHIRSTENFPEKMDGRFATSSPTDYLQRLSSLYGLSWFYYNGTLYINRSNTNITKPLIVGADSLANVKRALVELGILEPRFGWGELPEQSLVLLSGPPSYIALVEKMVANIPTSSLGQQVMVFRLRYANVDDRAVTFNGKETTTPGVATILRQLVNGTYSGSSSGGTNQSIGSRSQLVEIAKPVQVGTAAVEMEAPVQNTPLPSTPPAHLQRSKAAPSITADSRLNALIIKDTADTEPIYRQLITLLDHPTALIQIEAMIVDVDTSHISDLGINWAGRSGKFSAAGVRDVATAEGLVFNYGSKMNPASTIVDMGNALISRINILEKQNNAQVIGRPSILTSDNLPALITHNESFYVRVHGEKVANLQEVSAGMTLKVTPRVIQREGNNLIYLAVDIEDGQIIPSSDTTADSLPGTRTSTVNTQAVLTENESLLIGGYIRERKGKTNTGVPFLSKVPIVGWLFRNKGTNKSRAERLFMITPKIISLPVGQEYQQHPFGAIRPHTVEAPTLPTRPMFSGQLTPRPTTPNSPIPNNLPADSLAASVIEGHFAPTAQDNLATQKAKPVILPSEKEATALPLDRD